jgi:DNA-directed RNA polymerase subunit M/transcription elongation factor TFIIS
MNTQSTTPRTDKQWQDAPPANFGGMTAMADLARQLESELMAATELLNSHAPEGHNVTNLQYVEMSQNRDLWKSCAEKLATSEKCPNCNDVGWFTEWRRTTSGDPEPEQCQCEFCELTPNSKFHALNTFNTLKESPMNQTQLTPNFNEIIASLQSQLQDAKDTLDIELNIKEKCSQCGYSWSPSLIESSWCIFCIQKETAQQRDTLREELATLKKEFTPTINSP